MNSLRSPITILLAAFVALLAGCSQQAKLEEHLQKANAYYDGKDFASAEIEYKNALQIDSSIPEALGNLGLIYYHQGRSRQAYPFLNRVREVDPDNTAYRSTLSALFLESGEFEKAWEDARFTLEQDPSDPVAPLALQGAAVRLKRVDEARTVLSDLRQANESAAVVVALGMLEANSGQLEAAEVLFREAIVLDPNFSDGHIALGNALWARKDTEVAEASYRNAYQNATAPPSKRIRYAQFLSLTGKSDAARSALAPILKDAPNYVPGLLLNAQLLASGKLLDEGIEQADKALRLSPYNPEAALLSARLKTAKGDVETAIKQLDRTIELYPELANAHYQLALAYLADNQPIKSAASLTRTIAINPNHSEAILMQAALSAREGEPENAIVSLEKLIERNSEHVQAKLLLGQINLEENHLNDALEAFASLSQQLPSNPLPRQLEAEVLLRMGKPLDARKMLADSLQRSPHYVASLERLTDLDIVDKQFQAAIDRIDPLISSSPDPAYLHMLKGKVLLAGEDASGEAELKRAIELKPSLRTAYLYLAVHYKLSGRVGDAIEKLKSLLDIHPNDIEALMQIGALYELESDFSSARASYENVIKHSPNNGAAMNNLAYICSEHFDELDYGYELALKARDLLPLDPAVADTLGWITYKRGNYDLALGLVTESSRKLGRHPEIQYHLAKIHLARNDREKAAAAFSRALELGLEGDKANEAQRLLEKR